MALFDKLAQRGVQRLGRTPRGQGSILGVDTPKPIASPASIVNQTPTTHQATPTVAPTATPKPLTTTPTVDRINTLPQRGTLGSTFQGGSINKRFIADLPANEQLEGIQMILSGQDTNSEVVNNFVKNMSAQGKSPEEIRLAFIEQERQSANPLVLQ